jgi:ectoine hydroxylase-related dioxygenase (phytanoyl-CoA dioxygenase family)
MLKQILSIFRRDVVSEPRRAAQQLRSNGYTLIPAALTAGECDAICESFERFVAENPDEAAQFVMSTSRHSRLTNMHIVSEAARTAITKPRVMAAIDEFFGSPAFVATSLFFEQSSEQATHRDTPFFHTRPNNMFAGIWFALEDVHADAGPLQYFPGGHKLQVLPNTAATSDDILPTYYEFMGRLASELTARGIGPQTAIIKKGDCFIWHPELPHGGAPIRKPGLTRKSMVFHCAPEGESMYGWEEFFGVVPFAPKALTLVPMTGERRMIPHDKPTFAANN